MTDRFVAIDFETADFTRESACSVGVARVESGAVVERWEHLIRPATTRFVFTRIHGIRAADLRDAPTFAELWPELLGRLEGATFLVAHNAPFDRSVLRACCAAAELAEPDYPFECTLRLARRALGPGKATLPVVCGRLGIELRHHQAGADAEACARVYLALAGGARVDLSFLERAAQMLRGIVDGVACDRRLHDREIAGLSSWLESHAHVRDRPPFDALAEMLERILEDQVVDADEREELLDWCGGFAGEAPPATAEVARIRLRGMLEGIAADRTVTVPELIALRDWMIASEPFRTEPLLADTWALLERVLEDGVVTSAEHAEILAHCG